MKKNLIAILGPTASGKTAMAANLAADFHGEIISADSRQVYRGMDIGTGKDLSEFRRDHAVLPYHLIDIIEPQEEFNVFEFQKRFYSVWDDLRERKILSVLVGGTGLYLESVLTNYVLPPVKHDERLRNELAGKSQTELQGILLSMKPDLHNKTDLEDKERIIRRIEIEKARQNSLEQPKRIPLIDAGIFGIHWEREVLRMRIARRLRQRIDEGLIEEVSGLQKSGLSWQRLDSFGLEYRYIARYLQNIITRNEMVSKLEIAIGQFAKRQMTWFRRMEKKGVKIEWIRGDDYSYLRRRVLEMLP